MNDRWVKGMYAKYCATLSVDTRNHGIGHAITVANTCEKFARMVNMKEERINELKIAALFHDIGIADFGKVGHNLRGANMTREYLSNKQISNKEMIYDAVKNHTNGGVENLYCKILFFADKIDVCKNRMTGIGAKTRGNRQFAHFEGVDFGILNDTFIVKFKTNGKIDMNELNSYYFVAKIFTSIKALADHFKLKYMVLLDGKDWVVRPSAVNIPKSMSLFRQ